MTSKLETYILKNLKVPYFYNLVMVYGINDKDSQQNILSKYYGFEVIISGNQIYDTEGNRFYYEVSNGYWEKYEYDSNGNEIYSEDSNGKWVKREYNSNGGRVYYEDYDGVLFDNRRKK